MIDVIHKNILDASEQYIVHQTNCVTQKAVGLSQQLFSRFPEANVYGSRKNGQWDIPGSIIVRGKVINLMGQYYPGKPKHLKDKAKDRKKYFLRGLEEISQIEGISSLAIPWCIGCGLGGGNWSDYRILLEDWAKKHPHIKCRFYKI